MNSFHEFYIDINLYTNISKESNDLDIKKCFFNLKYIIPSTNNISLTKEKFDFNKYLKYQIITSKFYSINGIFIKNIWPGFILKDKISLFKLSSLSIKYILKTLSSSDFNQVAKDLYRGSIYINRKEYIYNSLNFNHLKSIFDKYISDLKRENITNINVLNFLEKYAHQGALHNAWTYVIMKKVALLGYTITQNNEYKCTFI